MTESLVPLTINSLYSKMTWENGVVFSHVLESSFYKNLKGGVQNTGRLFNWIRETCIERIQAIQVVFNTVNVGIVLYSVQKLSSEILERFSFSFIPESDNKWLFKNLTIYSFLGLTVSLGVLLVNRLSPKIYEERVPRLVDEEDLKVNQEDLEVFQSETLSNQQKFAKVLHTSKLVLDFALAFFSKNKWLSAVSLLTTSYSLWKNLQLKWVKFSTTFNVPNLPLPPAPPIRSLDVSYSMLVLPPSGAVINDDCAICLEKKVDMVFCSNHPFHRDCVSQIAERKAGTFLNNARIIKHRTDNYRNGVYQGTSYSYSTTLPVEDLPQCPNCRTFPYQNSLEIKVTDADHGNFNSRVNIVRPSGDRQYLFENLYAIYNVAASALTYLQTYPELKFAIAKIQKAMLITDCIGYLMTAYYLYQKVNAKYNPQNAKLFKVAFIASLIAVAAISYLMMLKVNAYLKSAVILKDFLKDLPISEEAMKTISIDWCTPDFQQWMQCLYINRIVSTVALSFFSNQKKQNMISAFTQCLSLFGISKLKWIEFSQVFETPLKKVVESGGSLSGMTSIFGKTDFESVKSVKLSLYALADSPNSLSSTIKSIYACATSFFDKSKWVRYWMVTKNQYGVEISKNIQYSITVQNIPSTMNYSLEVIDKVYGKVKSLVYSI